MAPRAPDEEVGRQILGIFMRYKVPAGGTLRRNNFFDVRDADFQRGLNFAIASKWIKQHLRDRYTYQLTEAGHAAGWRPELVASEPLQPEATQPEAVTTAPESPEPIASDRDMSDPGTIVPWKSQA